MLSALLTPNRLTLTLEFSLLYILTPLILYAHPSRWAAHVSLWLVTAYACFILHKKADFSWREAWHGDGWTARERNLVIARFVASSACVTFLTLLIAPDRLLSFPSQRPLFWLLVMLLYPLLSALPQELIFRSFFFRRYATLFPTKGLLLAVSAAIFGFIHIIFHNPVSPILSVACGFFLASSYLSHTSLKRAAIEHALYGDMVFTLGLGVYFLSSSYS